MRNLKELLRTPRMFYLPLEPYNSVAGLYDLVREVVRGDFVIVEVGSFAGVSSDLLARYCDTLYCVDIWTMDPAYQEIGQVALAQAESMFDLVWRDHFNIIPIQNYSTFAAQEFEDQSVDMVYIDARHDYPSVRADIMAWQPKVKPGGWVTGHDITEPGVARAVNELLGNGYKTYKDNSWAVQVN